MFNKIVTFYTFEKVIYTEFLTTERKKNKNGV